MYIITVSYMTVNGRKEAKFSCPVVVGPGPGQGRWIYTIERLFNLPKGVFSRPFRVILTVRLTFVLLSLRVQLS